MTDSLKPFLCILLATVFATTALAQRFPSKALTVSTFKGPFHSKITVPKLDSPHVIQSPTTLTRAEGGWSGGGGTGVACWANISEAKQAQSARAKSLPLPKHLYDSITTLEVTDFWERREKNFLPPFANETSDMYLQRILNLYFLKAAPSFKEKLEQALFQLELSEKKLPAEVLFLAPIEDTGPIMNYTENSTENHCSVVQIATRYARTINNVVETELFLDHELFNKLGLRDGILNKQAQVINQALLRLHEALYLLGYSINQNTSEKVRSMSSYLVLQESYDTLVSIADKTYAISPGESTMTGIQKYAMLTILYYEGFGEVPYIGRKSISTRKQQFKNSYKKYQEDFSKINASIDKLNLSEPALSQMKSASFAIWMSELKQNDAFIGATLSLLISDQVGDIYRLLDPDIDTLAEEKNICNQIDKWLERFGNPVGQNGILTVKMFRNAQQFCAQ